MKQALGKRIAGLIMSASMMFAATLPAQAAETGSVSIQIPVAQEFAVSGTDKADDGFSYLLTALEADAPMPEACGEDGWRFSINGNQDIMTAPIEFVHAGVFSYEIRLVQDEKVPGYVYDSQVYTVSVYVTNTEDGLEANLTAQKENGDKVSEIVFRHSYTSGDTGQNKPVKTGDSTDMLPVFGTAFLLAAVIIAVVLRKRTGKERD